MIEIEKVTVSTVENAKVIIMKHLTLFFYINLLLSIDKNMFENKMIV